MPQREFHKILNLIAISGIISLFFMLIISSCDDSPTGPRLPACWKHLVNSGEVRGSADFAPTWSPSGNLIAYASWFDSCHDERGAIYITDRSGIPKRPLNVFGAAVRWMPGDTMVIVNNGIFGGGQLILYHIHTHEATPLGIYTRNPAFDITSDGKFIYFEGPPLDTIFSAGIYRFSFADSSITPIVGGGHPSLSPDDKLLAIFRGPLSVFNIADSSLIDLAPRGVLPDWTADGKHIVYDVNRVKLFKTDLEGNSEFIADGSGRLSVSRQGKILYRSISPDDFVHLWIVNIDGSGRRQFTY